MEGGCAQCDPGYYQPIHGFAGKQCEPCLDGEYTGMGVVGATACLRCARSEFCAASVTNCNKITGLEQTFSTYPAETVVCVTRSSSDPCDLPEYCSSLVAQCDNSTDSRVPMVVDLEPCANDPLRGVDCWTTPTYTGAPLMLSALLAPPASATCDGAAVDARVRYFFAWTDGVSVMPCPTSADMTTSWWGNQLTTLAESPLLPVGTPYEVALNGSQLTQLQGQAVHVIAQLYEPVRESAHAYVCLERIIVDSSPPTAGSVACPLATDATDAVLIGPATPCFSQRSTDSTTIGLYYLPHTSSLPLIITASFVDAQSAIGSASGLSTLSVQAYSTSPKATPLYASPSIYCDDTTCGAALISSMQQWEAIGDFGAAPSLRFGPSARLSNAAQLAGSAWTAPDLSSGGALSWADRYVTLSVAATAATQSGTSLMARLPHGSGDLVISASVGPAAKCALRVTDDRGEGALVGVPLPSSPSDPFSPVILSYESAAPPPSPMPTLPRSPITTNGTAPSDADHDLRRRRLDASVGSAAPQLSLFSFEGACSLAYVLWRDTSLRDLGTLGVPTVLEPAAVAAIVPIPPQPAGNAVRLVATGTNNAGLNTSTVSATIVLDDTPPNALPTLVPCTVGGLDGVLASSLSSSAAAIWYQASSDLRVCWEPGYTYADAQSGILRIKWSLHKLLNPAASCASCDENLALWRSGSLPPSEVTTATPGMVNGLNASLSWPASDDALGLVSGQHYIMELQGVNRAGLTSAATRTRVAIGIDLSPPLTALAAAATCALDGCDPGGEVGVDAVDLLTRYQPNGSAVRVRWSGFVDAESGVAACDVALVAQGQPAPLNAPSAWRRLPDCHEAGEALLDGLELPHASSWTVWIRPINGAGSLATAAVSAAPVYVDTTPPNVSAVVVLDAADLMEAALELDTRPHLSAAPLQVCCHWSGFTDLETLLAIPAYEWSLSSHANLTADVLGWTATDATQACASLPLGTLRPNLRYRCAVRAINAASLVSPPVASDGFTYDATPPVGGWVMDGRMPDSDVELLHARTLGAMWGGFVEEEYGVSSLTYAASGGPCALWQNLTLYEVGNATAASFTLVEGRGGACVPVPDSALALLSASVPCVLPENTAICFVVAASNHHGHVVRRRSNGVTICSGNDIKVGVVEERRWSSPTTLARYDADYVASTKLTFTFHGFTSSCAPVERFIVEFQTIAQSNPLPLGNDVRWELVTGATNVTIDPLSPPPPLPVGVRYPWLAQFVIPSEGLYRARVCASDVLGNTACGASDGTLVDWTEPTGPLIVCAHFPTGQLGCGNSSAQLVSPVRDGAFLRWSGCTDEQSRVGYFTVTLERDFLVTYDVGIATDFVLPEEVTNAAGQTIVTVTCFNRAGLSISARLSPLSFDDAPPTLSHGALAVGKAVAVAEMVDGSGSVATLFVSAPHLPIEIDPSQIVDLDTGIAHAWLVARCAGRARGTQSADALYKDAVIAHGAALGVSAVDGLIRRVIDMTAVTENLIHVMLLAVDAAGNQATIALPSAVLFDGSPPTIDVGRAKLDVCDEGGSELLAQSSTSALRLCVTQGSLFAVSGVPSVLVTLLPAVTSSSTSASSVGSAGGSDGEVFWEGASLTAPLIGDAIVLSGLALPCDTRIAISVRGISGAGLITNASDALHTSVDVICSSPSEGSLAIEGVSIATPRSGLTCARLSDLPYLYVRWSGFGGGAAAASVYAVTISAAANEDASLASWQPTADAMTTSLSLAGRLDPQMRTTAQRVRIKGCNAIQLCTEASSQIRVVDDPPSAGVVRWQPQPSTTAGYLITWRDMSATWSGFVDQSESLMYEVCVGTTPLGCQLLDFAHGGVRGSVSESESDGSGTWSLLARLGSYAAPQFPLQCGATYHLAVRATNCAGLQRIVASDGVKHCCHPPSGGRVAVLDPAGEAVSFASSVNGLRAQWSGFEEACSGVRDYQVSLTDRFGASLWTAVVEAANYTGELALPSTLDGQLDAGARLTLNVQGTSHADLVSTSVSASFTLDRTAPRTGAVVVDWSGRASAEPYTHLAPGMMCVPPSVEWVRVNWPDAADDESGIAFFIFGTQLLPVDGRPSVVPTWLSVGSVRSLDLPLDSTMASMYAVRACNALSLCADSDWSHAVQSAESPRGGRVMLSHSDRATPGYVGGMVPALQASWDSFESGVNGSALAYEACVGTTPLGCQLRAFSDLGIENHRWSAALAPQFPLQCGATYHLAVRATNCAGLQRIVASDGVKHCCHPPSGGRVAVLDPAGEAVSFASSVNGLRAQWSGFEEACSGVRDYQVSLTDRFGASLWTAVVEAANYTGELALPSTLDGQLDAGARLTLNVQGTSHADLVSTSVSASFTLDRTAPRTGAVVVDWSGRASAEPYTHLAPGMMCVPPSVEWVRVNWPDAADDESGIASFELVSRLAAETFNNGSMPPPQRDTKPSHSRSTLIDPLLLAATRGVRDQHLAASFAVRACNRVGLCATSNFSRRVRMVNAPTGGVAVLYSGASDGAIGYLGGPSPGMIGRWSDFHMGVEGASTAPAASSVSNQSSLQYEVCLGTSPFGCQMLPFTSAGVSGQTWTLGGLSAIGAVADAFPCGAVYHLAVRATNCAGLQRVVASDGVKHCCHPPSGGRATVLNPAGDEVSFASSVDGLMIEWSGFEEACSGVHDFHVSLLDVSAGGSVAASDALWQSGGVNGTSIMIPADVDWLLLQGGTYEAVIVASSTAGLLSAPVASAAFTIDTTPPVVGEIRDGNGILDLSCIPSEVRPSCSWSGVFDDESGIAALEWGVGSLPNATDLQNFALVPWQRMTGQMLSAPSSSLEVGAHIYCTLRVTNGAGAVVVRSSDGAQLVEPNCKSGLPMTCATPLR